MAESDGASATRAIAESLGVAPSSLTFVRKTFISRQIIESTTRGYVDFSIPRMREYLSNNTDELMARFG